MTHAFRSPLALARTTLLTAALAAGAATPSFAVEPLEQFDIVLLQAGGVMEQRLEGGTEAMAEYLKRLGVAATEAMRQNPQQLPASGFIVVAIRPNGQAHAWFDFKPALYDKTTAALTAAVESTPPSPVKSGNVVFALRVGLWGGKPPSSVAPAPQVWKDVARQAGHKLDIDSLVDQTWPR